MFRIMIERKIQLNRLIFMFLKTQRMCSKVQAKKKLIKYSCNLTCTVLLMN
ncbi:MAG: hypothetical protein ACI93E_000530 [Flavobacteriales bacterium]|jgi:hypothetical protein